MQEAHLSTDKEYIESKEEIIELGAKAFESFAETSRVM